MEPDGSILDSIGQEIIGVMSPVSICMFLVVLLVYSLYNPATATTIRTAANLVYMESPTDSTAQKLEGSLLNAAVFIILIALVTFLLVFLYYYKFTKFLVHYTRFSAFAVFSSMGGSVLLSFIQHFNFPVDVVTFCVLHFNFTIVGTLCVLSSGGPIVLKQSYMVALGIIVAAWFTKLPEWTTWVLLVALAIYDLVAVLAPGGPLKLLVELAASRDEELPALIYEARPTVDMGRSGVRGSSLGLLVGGVTGNNSGSNGGAVELRVMLRNNNNNHNNNNNWDAESIINVLENESSEIEEVREDVGESSPLIGGGSLMERLSTQSERTNNGGSRENESQGEDMAGTGLRGLKLGLGDFVFYSVLVGRAAMYDLMTVYACYLVIISGLGCTLILLAVCRHALPALPISITLGILFYFLTRLLMEPFVVGTSTSLVMF
ncbi:presenilin-like protein At1g08700 [Olea europaea var. sylvestris]|uniref:Presenilin n=1 Tax=Olea europaea subsp. europaea TaxID=158383 RepID=A0A8S0TT29_OLEEU|nr:presenilin-like protein At1g08700 [Olea europaea var. sylvestris]CAA3008132.1 presenilin At1g08700 [Olea europaea subsp. europaea]